MSNSVTKFEFETNQITAINYKDEPVFLAKEIGQVLGYSDEGSKLSSLIAKKWADEFIDGKDYSVLTGKELKDIKDILQLSTPQVGSRAPQLMILTESGVNLVCMKSNKPIGKKLRRWLADEVLPQIARTGGFDASKDSGIDTRTMISLEKEKRLRAKLDLKKEELMFKEHQHRSGAIMNLIESLWGNNQISDKTYQSFSVMAAEIATGQDLAPLKPVDLETWLTPTSIAKRMGCKPAMVGRIITSLSLRNNADYSEAYPEKAKYCAKMVTAYRYNEAAVKLISQAYLDCKAS